jgi:hypothetical protein
VKAEVALPEPLRQRLAEVERLVGRRIVLRGLKPEDPEFRGRISSQPGHILVEYRDEIAGYFWSERIIEELLRAVETGQRDAVFLEGGRRDDSTTAA